MAAPLLTAYWRSLRKPLELELARGCSDSAIVGAGISEYTRLWAERLTGSAEEEKRLALSIARGLRDYAAMPVVERRRRVMAAIDLLRQQEAPPAPPAARKPAPKKAPATTTRKRRAAGQLPLPVGSELLEMPLPELAPRARWPELLGKLHLFTVRDLLYHVPRDWIEITRIDELADGARAAILGTAARHEYEMMKSRLTPHPLYKYTLTVTDDSPLEAWVTSITVQPPRKGGKEAWSPQKLRFPPGRRVLVIGKVERTGKIIQLQMEDIFEPSEAEEPFLRQGMRVPLYPLTTGVYQNQVYRAIMRVLAALGEDETANALVDALPAALREQYGLLPLVEALREMHRPGDPARHAQARKRLAFEEFLIPQLLMARRRRHARGQQAPVFAAPESLPDLVARLTDFTPTAAQARVLAEIEEDLRRPHPMNRLLQGDVGSGKTLIAAAALALAARSGFQAAIMAPTEILAEQLYLVLTRLLAPLGIAPVLLTGAVVNAERRAALEGLAAGTAAVAVGTHALIQSGVAFKDLGLVVVDEQHRFGVLQRAALRGKGHAVHALVMTATPIPRTLSLTVFGDLDLSVLDELPPGRHPVETRWLPTHHVDEAYRFIREEVARGRQAYVLCPLVEQSELLQVDAATEMAEELQRRVFPDLRVGLLHGRMRPDEKDAVMEDFRAGRAHILACTTVVEVGVDVPNATVMLVHNAERFGLSQLHQLRGRVGRSHHPSICYLVTPPRFSPDSREPEPTAALRRLRTLLDTQDGFLIAEADLEQRGPGEYLGTRQSGIFDFAIGSLVRDGKYLELARRAAEEIIAEDPEMQAPQLAELLRRVQRLQTRLDQFAE